jgi:tetratricopeptide (TPR) repeat protein
MNIEACIQGLSGFFIALGQKCLVAAITKWKEATDKAKEDRARKAIDEHEIAKALGTKFKQEVTKSLRLLKIPDEQLQRLLAIETDPLLQNELATQFAAGTISCESVVGLFLKQDPALEGVSDELLKLAVAWLDAMDSAIATNPSLTRIVTIRSHRRTQSDLAAIGKQLAQSELRDAKADERDDQRQHELLAAIASLGTGLNLSRLTDSGSAGPDHLKTQIQRRFDRARKQLIEESVTLAESEFRTLIEDLEAMGEAADQELLLRSYINLASSLWEQNRQDEAAAWFEKAAKLKPDDWRATRSRAFALLERGKTDEALKLFHELRELKPDDVEHVCNEAWVLKNSGRIQEAIELLESRQFPDANYFSILSLTHLRMENFDKAEQYARRALEIEPESEEAQVSLAYAVGFPIVVRRNRRETVKLLPVEQERARLLEAITYAEKAAGTLRKRQRLFSLGETLSNLVPFYIAAGEAEKALGYAHEALKIIPGDETTLGNLWCVQIRLEKYNDAVSTGEQLLALAPTVDAWEKKAHALIAADRSQEVIDEWDDLKSNPEFASSSDVIAIVARALSERHRSEEAVRMLTDILQHRPSDARLLAERGRLHEALGKLAEAEVDLTAAENAATTLQRPQILFDNAMFRYRRGKWDDAAARLRELGADFIQNPFLNKYLICLFNQGQYPECLKLAEEAIANDSAFVEQHHAIAARCHHACNNIGQAKILLDNLVARGTEREAEYRKLLAWTYWRLDELPQAYDVLIKGLKLKPNDLDSLTLMAAVCTVLRRYAEALEYAGRAVRLWPNSVRAHAAIVRTVFSCPTGFKIEDADLQTHFRSLQFLQEHESGLVKAIPVEPDFRTIIDLLKQRSQQIQRLEDLFHEKPLPMGFFAKRVGCSAFELWSTLLIHPRIPVRMAFGTPAEQQSEVAAANRSTAVSVDLIALFTLQHLNMLHLLPKLFSTIHAHVSLLDTVLNELRELQLHPGKETIAYIDGNVTRIQRSVDQAASIGAFLASIRDFLKSKAVTLTGLFPETVEEKVAKLLLQTSGEEFTSPVLVSKEKNCTLFSDDVIIRTLAHSSYAINGICTQAVLRELLQRSLISGAEYQDAILKLISSNYKFISEDAGTLRREYTKTGGVLGATAKAMINRVNQKPYDASTCVPMLAEFAMTIWREAAPATAEPRESWIAEIWRAIVKTKDPEETLSEFVACLAVNCFTQPEIFVALVTFAIKRVTELRDHHALLYHCMQEAIRNLTVVVEEVYPFWPQLARNWRLHGRLNQVLRHQGWLPLKS